MKKILSILMIAIISTMMLIASGTKEETAKTAETGEEKITLGLYWWGNQLRNDQTKQVADLYMKMHPNIEIKMEFVDFNNYWDKLSAMATSGNVPDVIQMGYPYIAQYANNGVLAELDPYFEDGTIDNLTMEEYYRKLTGKIGSDGENNNVVNASNQTLYNSVYSEYQSKSGVNTNEELAALIQWQSSYGAAAKIVTTVDQMLDTLLGLKS